MKKTARDIIILHTCSNYHNNTRYSSWDTKWDRHNFLSFWAFSDLYVLSPNNLENQNFENMKKVSGMSSFCTCVRGIANGGPGRPCPVPPQFKFQTKKGPTVSVSNIRDIVFYGCSEIIWIRISRFLQCIYTTVFVQFMAAFHFF